MLTSFGALHAHGHPIDWSRLYPTGGRVVEAPTYAWEHKPYWLEHTEPRASGSAEQAAHPLLARQLRLAGDGPLVAEGDLDDAALDRLGARRYGAARLAPAATWLELAGAAHGADAAVECTDLRLPAPFAATDDPAVAQVALRPDGEFTAHTVPHHGAARLRAAGRFRAARGPLDAEPDAGQGDELPAEAVRSWLDRLGVPGLRSAHATGGPGSVVVELVHEGADPRWRLHPGLLEACLHTLELAVPPDGPLTVEHIDGARVAGPLGPKVRVRASVTETAAGTVTGDISVFDADGVPVVAAHGVRLGPVRLRPISPETRQELEDLLYDLVWRERPREATPHEDEATPHEGTAADGTWLVAADRGGVGTALAELLRARGDDVRVLDPTADLDRLTQEVRELVTGPGCRGAVHLWGLDVPGDPGPDDLDDASAVYASVGRLAAALDATAKASAPHVWYVTRGARQAGPEGASPVVGQAPIWTLGTVAGLEHPGAWGGLVDLDPATADPERAAEAILAELTGPDGEDRLALRQGHRYAGRLARRPVPERVAEPPELSPDGTYLVAAGASETHGVARAMADWLTSRGAAHVLVCGNAVEPADPDGRIRTERLDLADPATVRDLLLRLDAAGTPLRGVVWAAPEWSLAQDQQPPAPEAIAADLRNRALGARHLDAMAGDLDLFVVFAGAATSWGSMGAGRQAPADALLAALAERRTAAGRPALAVHWAPWDDEAALEQQTRVQMTRSGLSPLVPDSAVAALDYLAGTDAAEVCVARVDWSLMLPLYRQAIRWPLFDELAAQEAEAAKEAGPSAVAERLAGLPPEDRKDHLVDTVLGEVAVVLGMDAADDLEPTEGFFEIGMNSVTALELKVRLERLLRHELPATLAFECPTAADLAGFLLTELDGAADSSGEGPQPPQPAEPPETTTDEEPGDVMARFDAEMAAAEKATR
jgi:acyl carrier protein